MRYQGWAVDAGEAFSAYQDKAFRNLTTCKRLQLDEIWSFVYAKEANAPAAKKLAGEAGDIWSPDAALHAGNGSRRHDEAVGNC